MKLCIILVSMFAVIHSRPQDKTQQDGQSTVEKTEKITIIPFYGGAKGQALQIVESKGQVITSIIKIPENFSENEEETINTAELENPPLPSKYELDEFGNYIKNIQNTALKVIKLQEIAKRNGKLTDQEEVVYKESMDSLNQSAKSLAKLQEEATPLDFESREGLSAWFERRQTNKDKNKRKEDEDKRKKEEKKRQEEENKRKVEENKKKEEEKRKEQQKKEEEKRKEEENRKKEEERQEEDDDDDDSITINLPPEDASIAEAKPVGLAVAGVGGVAASKPIATAVVGPAGLAIARPVGTAIAGVSPDQALAPIYAEGYMLGTKTKTSSSSGNKQDSADEYINRLIAKYHQN